MSTPSRRWTITLRDGARVTLRPIAPEDKPLLAASFERLSEESRYRRFFTPKNELSPAELAYLVDVDHKDHEAIIAIDPSSGEALGIARSTSQGRSRPRRSRSGRSDSPERHSRSRRSPRRTSRR